MKTGLALTAAAIATMAMTGPALANGKKWDRHDQRKQANAYAQGYRDGQRAQQVRHGRQVQVRGPNSWQPYNNGSRWDQGYRYSNNSYPVYQGAAVRGQQPFWWGSNGQMHCRRQDGTTGLIVGALAGGSLGNIIAREGDKRLGSVIGGTLGAVLGNELAKGNVRCR